MKKEQLVSFNDAVIAIIITLMVLDIKLPALTWVRSQELLRHLFAYAISFFTIAIGWMNLQLLFAKVSKIAPATLWLDLLLLFFLSLLPLPTQALGERFFEPASHVFFGLVQALVSVAFKLLINRLAANSSSVSYRRTKLESRLDQLTIVVYLLSMLVCYWSVYLSTLLFLVPPIIYFTASRRQLERQL